MMTEKKKKAVEAATSVSAYERRMGLLVEALRSGRFEQGNGVLCQFNSSGGKEYCCLGVACEVYRRETGHGEWKPDSDPSRIREQQHVFSVPEPDGDRVLDGNLTYNTLPIAVMHWFGFRTIGGDILKHDQGWEARYSALWKLNDRKIMDFGEIADLIESKPRGLFTWTEEE